MRNGEAKLDTLWDMENDLIRAYYFDKSGAGGLTVRKTIAFATKEGQKHWLEGRTADQKAVQAIIKAIVPWDVFKDPHGLRETHTDYFRRFGPRSGLCYTLYNTRKKQRVTEWLRPLAPGSECLPCGTNVIRNTRKFLEALLRVPQRVESVANSMSDAWLAARREGACSGKLEKRLSQVWPALDRFQAAANGAGIALVGSPGKWAELLAIQPEDKRSEQAFRSVLEYLDTAPFLVAERNKKEPRR